MKKNRIKKDDIKISMILEAEDKEDVIKKITESITSYINHLLNSDSYPEIFNIRNVKIDKLKSKIYEIKRGDIIKTDSSDKTLVLECDGKNGLLFVNDYYIQAYDLYFDETDDKLKWNFAKCVDHYPFIKESKSPEEAKKWITQLVQTFFECEVDEAQMIVDNTLDVEDEQILNAIKTLRKTVESQLPLSYKNELRFNSLINELEEQSFYEFHFHY